MAAEMKIGAFLVAAASAFWTIAMSHGAAGATVVDTWMFDRRQHDAKRD
jgi:hypothetical protein